MVQRVLRSWIFAWVAFWLVAGWWAVNSLPPASYWFAPQAMIVADVDFGEPIVIHVDRDIKHEVLARWYVTIRQFDGEGWQAFCTANGQATYSPEARLPEPLTLSWWTDGNCGALPPGQYVAVTSWVLEPIWSVGTRRTSPMTSNVFEVRGIGG